MKYFALLLIALVAVSQCTAEVKTEDGVIVLTDDNFEGVVKSHDFILVEFYAPWCGHCKQLAPEYAKAAETLKKEGGLIALGKVDATVQKDLGKRYEVSGYPTLKYFIKGEPMEYNGGRTADAIVAWVNKKSGPASIEVDAELLATKKTDNKVLVVFFGDKTSSEFELYEKTAKGFEDVVFVHATPELNEGKSGVVLFKHFDEKINHYEGAVEEKKLKAFVEGNQYATLMDFDQKAAERIFGGEKPCIILFVKDTEADSEEKKTFLEIAQKLKGKIIVSISQVEKDIGQRLGEYVGVTADTLPTVRFIEFKDKDVKKYVLDGAITFDNVMKQYEDFSAGNLKATFKSEEIPETPVEKNVYKLVGKNFLDVVGQKEKCVFVKFYAPWCGHCKTLAPIWEELGKKFEGTNVVVSHMDSTLNEVEGVSVQGFPTLKLYVKGDMTPLDYSGERKLDDLAKYLNEKCKDVLPVEAEKKADL